MFSKSSMAHTAMQSAGQARGQCDGGGVNSNGAHTHLSWPLQPLSVEVLYCVSFQLCACKGQSSSNAQDTRARREREIESMCASVFETYLKQRASERASVASSAKLTAELMVLLGAARFC
jgi:hypothetical protein